MNTPTHHIEIDACEPTNICPGGGYCSKYVTPSCDFGESWNGLCAYQDGRPVYEGEEAITLDCCERGCRMPAFQWQRWNGLCAHQR